MVLRGKLLALLGAAAALLLAVPLAQAAAWQDTHKALRVGFLAVDGASYDIRRLEPFRAYLQAAVGMPVELVPAVSYAALIDAQATDRVQYAIHSATSYVATVSRCQCVAPLAVPTAFDGAKGFYSVLLARADSDIHVPADAKDKVLAVTGDDSIAGRLAPLQSLAQDGIDPADHFTSVVEAADPAAAIGALEAGNADLAVGWSSLTGDVAKGYDFGVLTSLVAAGTLSMDSVRVVWQSPLIPFGPHALRTDVPDDVKSRLANALSMMAAAAPVALDAVDRSSYGGGGFASITDKDYAVVEDLVGLAAANPAIVVPGTVAPADGSPAVPLANATPPAPAEPAVTANP